jgi:hypothetical protein
VPISAKVRAAKILLDDENGVEDCTESVTIVEDI